MSAAYLPSVLDRSPQRGVAWVLGVAVSLLAIAAWLVILLHLVLVVRAEMRLGAILQQAETFSQLPGVDSHDLGQFVQTRLVAQGFHAARVQVAPQLAYPGKVQVQSIETSRADVGVRTLKPLWQLWGHEPILVGTAPSPVATFFAP